MKAFTFPKIIYSEKGDISWVVVVLANMNHAINEHLKVSTPTMSQRIKIDEAQTIYCLPCHPHQASP